MCGIVGYIGKNDAQAIMLDGLKRLEYRGYDSSGIAMVSQNQIFLYKQPGKIKDLVKGLVKKPFPKSGLGLAHTRWATHGAPTKINAHPHTDCKNKIIVVHNGIIENYLELKKELIKEGHQFKSQTDTEVIAHLVEKYYRSNTLKEAVKKTINRLRGSYALGVISLDEPDKIVASRNYSPLIIGIGEEENFIASDVPAILRHTNKVIYLADEEMVVLTSDRVEVFSKGGKKVIKKPQYIRWSISEAEKQGFDHFMIKEISEQPKILRQILSVHLKDNKIAFDELKANEKFLRKVENIIIVACGTAYHAGLVTKYAIEELLRIPVYIDVSSEFRYRRPIIKKNTLVIAISQSGETADTLAAVKEAKAQDAKVLAICNVVGSTLSREADIVVYTLAGPEISVASTKAYTAQVATLYLIMFYLAKLKNILSKQELSKYLNIFKNIASLQEEILKNKKQIQEIAKRHHNLGSFLYLGRQVNYPSALEGALKLKEISYIPAEGYAAGEMKHGPIALIDEYRAVVCISPESKIYEKMISNIQEIKAREGKIIAIATEGDNQIKTHTKEIIYIPKTQEIFVPLLVAIPLQLLAYYIAVERGCDVDQPRNLAKSVTVE
ncbi:MAG: glutamine--fructose-6-phosphate transaminase (isomerizing) [Candidatus Omnitrophota bacterium]